LGEPILYIQPIFRHTVKQGGYFIPINWL